MKLAVAVTTVTALLALTACGSADAGSASGEERMQVVAAFYPLQWAAEWVGGEHVEVTGLNGWAPSPTTWS